MVGSLILVREIRKFREGLYQVLRGQKGAALVKRVEHVFELAKARQSIHGISAGMRPKG